MPAPVLNKKFTYADYLTWLEEERWELIRGEPHSMTPVPRPHHQRIVAECTRQIAKQLDRHICHFSRTL